MHFRPIFPHGPHFCRDRAADWYPALLFKARNITIFWCKVLTDSSLLVTIYTASRARLNSVADSKSASRMINIIHLSCLSSSHMSCLSSRYLPCLSSRRLSCLTRRNLSTHPLSTESIFSQHSSVLSQQRSVFSHQRSVLSQRSSDLSKEIRHVSTEI